ncbi:MarR family winged helix-turn-helix transcriptional regulator [Pendulispora albinea]|uniref:MarR family transcriptional regulator n=1 Tax=Pendulispora albinea TaxID=2741071 RepID=A0ABZ2M9V8_9BACT
MKKESDPSRSLQPASGTMPLPGPADALARRAPRGSEELGRELSARTILFHQAVAERMGLSVTDHKCLDIAGRASLEGPLTAGKLAELTGLTTGAITGVLDRLEKGGFVRREKDPSDRRQVRIRILPDRDPEYMEVFLPFAKAWEELTSRYSPEEMARVEDFFRTSLELLRKETERVRAMTRVQKAAGGGRAEDATELSAPFTAETSGYLEIARGAINTRLHGAVGPNLYSGRFVGATPRVTAQDGRVLIEYTRSILRAVSFKQSASDLVLNPAIPWHIVIRGGTTKLVADLRALTLRGIDISGGASELWVQLPRPHETVPLRIRGGAQRVTLLRPQGVPARLSIKSGAAGLTIDTLHLDAVGGKTDWQSPDFDQATDRYDIEVTQGADGLTVGTLPPVTYPTRDE